MPQKDSAKASESAPSPSDSQLKMQTPIQPKAAVEPKPEQPKTEEEEWRIQNIGLTYTFHDLDSLHSWLSGRPTLEGVKVARGKDEWKELGDYPDVMTTELITKFFPLGDVPSSKSPKIQTSDNPVLKDSTLNGITPSITTDSLLSASSLSPITVNGGIAPPISKATDLSTAVTSKSSMQQLKKERAKAKQVRQNSKKQIILFGILAALLVVAGIFLMRYWRTGEIPLSRNQQNLNLPSLLCRNQKMKFRHPHNLLRRIRFLTMRSPVSPKKIIKSS